MSAIDECRVCSNPDAATWRERFEHGCPKPGEIYRCEWCGEPHQQRNEEPRFDGAGGRWCNDKCYDAHKTANPECTWFCGYIPIEDTLPGGRFDGIWEESGLKLDRGE